MARIRRLSPEDASAYRSFMLDAYARQPDAFTATVAEREPLPMDWWAARLSNDWVVGTFADRQLVGTAGLRRETRPRTNHKASLFGLVVAPAFQGRGRGRALATAVLDHALAMPALEVLQLKVFASNAPALRLYESLGFHAYGTEARAVRVGDRFVSVVHMARAVGAPPQPPDE